MEDYKFLLEITTQEFLTFTSMELVLLFIFLNHGTSVGKRIFQLFA